MTVTVVLVQASAGGFTAFIPALPGCISEGGTRKEAMDNIHKSLGLYLMRIGDDIKLDKEYELVELPV
ncbi:MAG: type II toxin-antitoxin system HicB family antitoxin [bacterium]|nr:type II toxin-antitoxin system HicB family antitoxin [bacterium]